MDADESTRDADAHTRRTFLATSSSVMGGGVAASLHPAHCGHMTGAARAGEI